MSRFSPERYILDVDSRWVDAVPLELLNDEITWMAKYLVHKDWKKAYLLNFRKGWLIDDYFTLAEKLKKINEV